ncbi:MAG: ABC transporter substrate-binding protein [Spirochaetia bacterium]|nr:ABC transporter substrate-binding protein [Spirochaetia bacterium]
MKKTIIIIIYLLSVVLQCKDSLKTIRIGGTIWPGYEPLYMASSLNFFNSNVRMIDFSSASEVLRSFENGNLEIAALTLDEVIYLHSKGYKPKIILIMDISNGADVVLAKPYIKKPSDLIGKKIGVEYTALGAYFFARFLQENNITPEKITLVPSEVDSHESIYLENKVDAVITFEPIKTKLLSKGAVNIFDSSNIPGEIIDVLVTREDIYENNKEEIQNVVNVWHTSLDYIKKDFSGATKFMNSRLKLSEDELKKTYKEIILADKKINEEILSGENPKIKIILEKLYDVMKKNKIITQEINIKNLY